METLGDVRRALSNDRVIEIVRKVGERARKPRYLPVSVSGEEVFVGKLSGSSSDRRSNPEMDVFEGLNDMFIENSFREERLDLFLKFGIEISYKMEDFVSPEEIVRNTSSCLAFILEREEYFFPKHAKKYADAHGKINDSSRHIWVVKPLHYLLTAVHYSINNPVKTAFVRVVYKEDSGGLGVLVVEQKKPLPESYKEVIFSDILSVRRAGHPRTETEYFEKMRGFFDTESREIIFDSDLRA